MSEQHRDGIPSEILELLRLHAEEKNSLEPGSEDREDALDAMKKTAGQALPRWDIS